jgi:hypothetical protein
MLLSHASCKNKSVTNFSFVAVVRSTSEIRDDIPKRNKGISPPKMPLVWDPGSGYGTNVFRI